MRSGSLLGIVLVILLTGVSWGEEGLVAAWNFDEGSGATVKDQVGSAHGTIGGAMYVPVGRGFALRLDGVDDFVDFGNAPSLSPENQITLESWVYAEKTPSVGEPGIVGKGYDNYVLTYYTDGHVWWYAGESGVNCRAPMPVGGWHHVVGTYDGHTLRLYVDGQLASVTPGKAKAIPRGHNFWVGKSQGTEQYTKNAHFAGMVDDVRVYDRALAPAEVLEHYRTTHVTGQVDLTAYPYYANREVVANLDLRGLGALPEGGATVRVELVRPGAAKPLVSKQLSGLTSWAKTEVSLQSRGLAAGDYELRAAARDRNGKPLGRPTVKPLVWPAAPSWGVKDPHVKVLNSLVTELRHERDLRDLRSRFTFTNPREGWVFFRTEAAKGSSGRVTLDVPGCGKLRRVLEQKTATDTVLEGMRRLPAGEYEAILNLQAGARVEDLVIRAIPEIGYCRVDCGPQLKPYGPCDWPFLEKHVLPHINLAVSRGAESERERWQAWRAQGKRWLVETPLPGIGKTDGVSAAEVEQTWVAGGKVAEPLLDGMLVDEFGAGNDPIWQSWHEGLKRLKARPEFAGKVFYPYCGPLFGAKGSQDFAQTVMDAGWAVALERYLPEERTESGARAAIQSHVIGLLQAWKQAQPEVVPHCLIVWGWMIGAPPESCNVDPGVDYKAFMDLQMNAVANDPTTFGLYGVTTYLSAYSDEETIRYTARLYRHYCIEGRTDRLTENYRLPHLANPDFEDGLTGWNAQPAEAEAIGTGTLPGLSFLEGRYPMTTQGNTYAVLKRSAAGPNRLTQTAQKLEPGKLYSLKLLAADLGDLQAGKSDRKVLGLKVDLSAVEVIPEKTFQYPFPSCYSHVHGPFNAQNPAYFNLYNIVFRARSRQTVLTITDWASDKDPGGPVGQQILCNFAELQPYYGE